MTTPDARTPAFTLLDDNQLMDILEENERLTRQLADAQSQVAHLVAAMKDQWRTCAEKLVSVGVNPEGPRV